MSNLDRTVKPISGSPWVGGGGMIGMLGTSYSSDDDRGGWELIGVARRVAWLEYNWNLWNDMVVDSTADMHANTNVMH